LWWAKREESPVKLLSYRHRYASFPAFNNSSSAIHVNNRTSAIGITMPAIHVFFPPLSKSRILFV
jgi:hypothetical protein